MSDLFQFIEENIFIDFDTELLSRIGYVSRDKLYHDFYSLSGHSVKEYIRKRRLSNALALIKTSDMNLTDIAFQCGYASYLTLWRAVKQTLGLSPSAYRNSSTYYFFPPFNGEPMQTVTVSNETIPVTLRIVFYHSSLTGIENLAVNAFLQACPDFGGRIFGRNEKQEGRRFCYELYVTDTNIKHSTLSPYCLEAANEMPGISTTFATSTIHNTEPGINYAWDYLYAQWLQNSMFEYTGEPYYEEYILKNNRPAKLKLYLPIRQRGTDTKITLIHNPGLHFITATAKGHNAEEEASQIVFDYVKSYLPYMINTSKEIYVRKEGDTCGCGIRINPELRMAKNENITHMITDHDHYLVLESSVTGDYDRYVDVLLAFARDNGMGTEQNGIFAVYCASEGFRGMKIKMYCPVQIRTK